MRRLRSLPVSEAEDSERCGGDYGISQIFAKFLICAKTLDMYCDCEEEIQKNPEAFLLMEEIANGNSDALHWMKAFWSFTHFIDDCVDKDRIATSDESSEVLALFVESLVCNKFFLKNKTFLYPLIVSACCRWRVGDSLDKGDHDDQIRAQVVRCGDIDIYLGVAFIIGGFSHMAKCADKCRTYDIN